MLKRGLCPWMMAGMVALLLCGCGKKGDPLPPQLKAASTVSDLRAGAVAGGVGLDWSGGEGGAVEAFRVERSAVPAGEACPGCPQEFHTLETLGLSSSALQRPGRGRFGYLDATAVRDRYHVYRVSACDSRGRCGPPSAPAGVSLK